MRDGAARGGRTCSSAWLDAHPDDPQVRQPAAATPRRGSWDAAGRRCAAGRPPAARAPRASAEGRVARARGRHRRGRLHRLAPDRAAARATGTRWSGVDCFTDYYDPALKRANLGRPLRAPALPAARARPRRRRPGARCPDVDAGVPPGGPGRRARVVGRRVRDLRAPQRAGDPAPARALSRRGRCERFVYASSSSVYGDAERCPTDEAHAAAPVLALRRDQAGRRAPLPALRPQLRRAGGGAALLHRVRPAPAARHGVPPLLPGAARRARTDRRSTATARSRATSRSSTTPWRPTCGAWRAQRAAGGLQRRRRLAGRRCSRRSASLERALGGAGAAAIPSRGSRATRAHTARRHRARRRRRWATRPRYAGMRATGLAAAQCGVAARRAGWRRRPAGGRRDAAPAHLRRSCPAYNEAESLPRAAPPSWSPASTSLGMPWEVIYVDDGSTRRLDQRARASSAPPTRACARVVSAATSASRRRSPPASARARGELRASRSTPTCRTTRPSCRACSRRSRAGSTWSRAGRCKRHDPSTKTLPSKLFNAVTGAVAGIKLHDFNCGLKLYRREVVDVDRGVRRAAPLHAGARALARASASARSRCTTARGSFGRSKFGAARFVNGFLDLIAASFISTSGAQAAARLRPHRRSLFGGIGMALSAVLRRRCGCTASRCACGR